MFKVEALQPKPQDLVTFERCAMVAFWLGLGTKTNWLHVEKDCGLGSNQYICYFTSVHTYMK